MISMIDVFIKRYPVPIYFALVFIFSWGAGLLVIDPEAFPLSFERVGRIGALVYIGILAGPCLTGLLLTGLIEGQAGFRELLLRLRRWRVGAIWYALALLPPVVMTATSLLLSFISSDFRPALFASNDKTGLVMRAVGPSLMVGFLEEIGWTGFAVPRLRSRHSIIVTGLIVGLLWGAWHFPLFWEANTFSATLPFAILFARLFSWLPAFRVLMVWVYDHTRSLLVVMLMHAVLVANQFMLLPAAPIGMNLLTHIIGLAAAMWLLLVAIAVANRGELFRQQARTRPT